MARNSLSIDIDGGSVAANGYNGYFLSNYTIEKLRLAPWESVIGPKVIVEWSE